MVYKMRNLFLFLYYTIGYHLPSSYIPGGAVFNVIRVFLVKRIFKKCGKISTIDRHAYFGNGKEIEIGDYSGIGENNHLPNNIKIGNYVMMGPDIYIVANNHSFDSNEVPMCQQDTKQSAPTIIEDDCWIGARVIMTPGRHVKRGSIIAAGCDFTKDFAENSIVGGNPAILIKRRGTI